MLHAAISKVQQPFCTLMIEQVHGNIYFLLYNDFTNHMFCIRLAVYRCNSETIRQTLVKLEQPPFVLQRSKTSQGFTQLVT